MTLDRERDKPINKATGSVNATTDFEITLFDNVLSSGVPYTTLELKDNRVVLPYITKRTKICLLVPSLRVPKMLPEVSSKEIILKINVSCLLC